MNFFICDCCGEIYTNHFEVCPRAECIGGAVMPVDELMIPIIRALVDKEYVVTDSCSGHAYLSGSYPQVRFDSYWAEEVGRERLEEIFSDLPGHWMFQWIEINRGEDGLEVHASLVSELPYDGNAVDCYYHVIEENLALLDFVKDIPVIDLDSEEFEEE